MDDLEVTFTVQFFQDEDLVYWSIIQEVKDEDEVLAYGEAETYEQARDFARAALQQVL